YGINTGINISSDGVISTVDTPMVDKFRPIYWNSPSTPPDLRFETLGTDPIPALESLADSLRRWGDDRWGESTLQERAAQSHWSAAMQAEAKSAADAFSVEVNRLNEG